MTPFSLPDSVVAYWTDLAVRAGVDALGDRLNTMPDDVDWANVPLFYDALLAAIQVRIESAKALAALWDAVWPDQLGAWRALNPVEQTDFNSDLTNTVENCWFNPFVRAFKCGKGKIFTYVTFDEHGIYAGVAAYARGRDLKLSGEGFEFNKEDQILWSGDDVCEIKGEPDLTALRGAAARLAAEADRAVREADG